MNTSYIKNLDKRSLFFLLLLCPFFTIPVRAQNMGNDRLKADSIAKHRDSIAKIQPLMLGYKPKANIVGSMNTIQGSELTATPTSFYKNALSGRLAGLNVAGTTGLPGQNIPTLAFRGRTPLVLIDGIPRNLDEIDPSDIESVTLLKDAVSTALLGNRGSGGALSIKTKNGKNINGYNFSVTAQTGPTDNLKQREILSSGDYARLFNEALANDGRAPIFSPAQIQAYQAGSDPFRFPNVNWRDEILKNNGSFSRVNVNSSGGDDKTTYSVSLDYLDQQGGFVTDDNNQSETNPYYNRFVFKTNLDVALTKSLQATMNLYATNSVQNQPGAGAETIYANILNTPRLSYPIFNNDSTRSLGASKAFTNNIYGQAVRSGYNLRKNNDGFADLSLRQSLDNLTKGLWLKARGSFYYNTVQVINRSINLQTRELVVDPTSGNSSYIINGGNPQQANLSSVPTRSQDFFVEGSAGYSKMINNANKLDLLLLYSFQNFRRNGALPEKFNTAGLSASYAIKGKYIVEGALSYSGDSYFIPSKQFDVYPALGLAWNVDREDFFKKDGFISSLRVKTSYGKTGSADASYFGYQYTYRQNDVGYYFGTPPTVTFGIEETGLPVATRASYNYKLDAGIDMSFSKGKGSLLIDYYRNDLKGLLQVRGSNASIIGIAYPSENIRDIRYSGFEVTTGWADKIGAVGYSISGNISLTRSKIVDIDEQNIPFPWMQKTGQRVDQVYGYISDGYVSTAGQGPVVEGYTSVPGDLKYKDLNNDGVINLYDVTGLRKDNPFINYGISLRFNYKNFDFSALLQGVANRDVSVTELGEWAFRNDGTGNAFEQHLNRWTPATAATATYPRLSIGPNINNNVNSSFWMQNLNYLRLKNAEVGYNFKGQFLSKIKVSAIRLFVNGYNLLTFTGADRFDPESLSLAYPLQQVINGGLNVRF